ncbi:unnamed protein product [Cuscuta epithymum]|uniref:Uncharacterized protein n=1 Tax=Cuscuta epithymum TaxID=186058 RepID=A0AAV0EUP0_9ASTE|nr:unnamed protein product [Cuscuta epithymum]
MTPTLNTWTLVKLTIQRSRFPEKQFFSQFVQLWTDKVTSFSSGTNLMSQYPSSEQKLKYMRHPTKLCCRLEKLSYWLPASLFNLCRVHSEDILTIQKQYEMVHLSSCHYYIISYVFKMF